MKCNKCGKQIEETEKFCRECKIEIKNISSRMELRELEKLIEKQKRLNDLENTKELNDLEVLVTEEKVEENIEDNKTRKFEIKEENTKKDVLLDIMDEKETDKKSNKKLVIIIAIICLVIVILILLLLFIFGKSKEPVKQDDVIDYEKIINEYGNSVVEFVDSYIKEKDEIPEWSYIIDNIDYDKYNVKCSTHNVYSDGSLYLSGCKVNDKKVDYTYGEELVEEESKIINIYKETNDESTIYLTESNKNSTLAGFITCKTNDCEYVAAYDKYVLIKEDNKSFLYDYTNDSIVFGPFDFNNEKDLLTVNNTLYGIYYKNNGINNIYNVQNNKVLENVKGSLLIENEKFDSSIMYKYNYVISENNGKYEFINLKTGNISYTIKEKIDNLIEDSNKKIVYIITNVDNSNKVKIYNSNGKALFDGKEYSNFIVGSNNLLVSTENNFKVYDKNLKLKTNSINYDKILGLYEDFVIAVKDSNIILLNAEDNQLAIFENAWNEGDYVFYNDLTRKNEKGIYFIIENKKIPLKEEGHYIEYYYMLSTKESGFTNRNSI